MSSLMKKGRGCSGTRKAPATTATQLPMMVYHCSNGQTMGRLAYFRGYYDTRKLSQEVGIEQQPDSEMTRRLTTDDGPAPADAQFVDTGASIQLSARSLAPVEIAPEYTEGSVPHYTARIQ